MKPLHVAFVWHMHQPYYKDDLTNTYLLPWVRLRSAKDYYKMPSLLEAYPKVKATFNLVPSLLAQIEDYGKEESVDLFLNLSKRPAGDLSAEERDFVLRWMRESPRALRVQQSPRYLELASRQPDAPFTSSDVRDLQVWFNLAWCDPVWVEQDPRLAELKRRDRDYTEGDKAILFQAQLERIRSVIPKYRELADRGQVELTFSPYYHPILPLICHVDSARSANPHIQLPERHFSHREDAERQIELGQGLFERMLGRRPKAMWPSEMAVGESVIGLAEKAKLDWMISDEEVLARSLDGHFNRDEHLYQPMRVSREGGGTVSMVFRDSQLSNVIGFDYQRMSSIDAARDLMGRLRRIRDVQGERDFLAVIALDGENAWEFYPRDGHDFLNALYTELESSTDVVTTTVSEFIAEHPPRQQLHHLHTGSWIGASLDTWIGDPEHDVAWDLLAETRDWLEAQSQQRPKDSQQQAALAWREILITEGSDWFWWFSRKHDSGMDPIWDNQFRLHLRNVYKLMGARAPARLFQPIIKRAPTSERGAPAAPISPKSKHDPAWAQAGYYLVGSGFGALHRPAGFVERVYYGNDDEHLYVRIDSPRSAVELEQQKIEFWLYVSGPPAVNGHGDIGLPLPRSAMTDLGFDPAFVVRITPRTEGGTASVGRVVDPLTRGVVEATWEVDDPFAVGIPFSRLSKRAGDAFELALVVSREGRDIEVIPPTGALGVRVPGESPVVEIAHAHHLKVLVASAELAPFAKLGGVADVAAALSKELRRLGHDVRAVMPRYRQVDIGRYSLKPVAGVEVPLGTEKMPATIFEGRLGELPVYFIDCPALYDRDGMFGFGDDDARSVYFCRAALEMLPAIDFFPDVVHVHDWWGALIPNLLDRVYASEAYADIASALTIHNLSAQGVFGFGALMLAGLQEWGLIRLGIPGLDNVVNVLGRGIHFADVVNTVSERYAKEIQTPEYGEGLDELLRRNTQKLHGILNGIDYEIFDPQRDPNIPHHYSAEEPQNKALCRAALRRELGLEDVNKPLCAIVSRFYDVKGFDLIEQALPELAELGLQMVVIGTGDRRYEDMFRRWAGERPHQFAVAIGFDAALAQRIYAGADMLWMPSRFEPGGLAQLIALRYGTIPVVRATGGLADTIRDYDPVAHTGNGFRFGPYDAWQFFAAVVRGAENFRHPAVWSWLVQHAMKEDVSWSRSALKYVQLYLAAITARRERRGVPLEVSAAGKASAAQVGE